MLSEKVKRLLQATTNLTTDLFFDGNQPLDTGPPSQYIDHATESLRNAGLEVMAENLEDNRQEAEQYMATLLGTHRAN